MSKHKTAAGVVCSLIAVTAAVWWIGSRPLPWPEAHNAIEAAVTYLDRGTVVDGISRRAYGVDTVAGRKDYLRFRAIVEGHRFCPSLALILSRARKTKIVDGRVVDQGWKDVSREVREMTALSRKKRTIIPEWQVTVLEQRGWGPWRRIAIAPVQTVLQHGEISDDGSVFEGILHLLEPVKPSKKYRLRFACINSAYETSEGTQPRYEAVVSMGR